MIMLRQSDSNEMLSLRLMCNFPYAKSFLFAVNYLIQIQIAYIHKHTTTIIAIFAEVIK